MRSPKRVRRFVATGGIVAILACAALVAADPHWSPFHRPTSLEELAAAAGSVSCCDARLAGIANTPSSSPTRGSGTSRADWRLLGAVARAEQEAGGNPDPHRTHALGIARLLMVDYDGAVTVLERAVAASPQTAPISNDLAAAYLARGQAANKDEDVFKALALADRALRVDPALQEASYNRALALQRLPLRQAARQAFELYLNRDSQSAWAEAARVHLVELKAPAAPNWPDSKTRLEAALDGDDARTVGVIERQFPQAARELLEDDLLPEWADAVLAGRPSASMLLERAWRLSSAMSTTRDDTFFRDTVDHLKRVGAPLQVVAARGLLEYRNGRRLQQQERASEAAAPFAAATEMLDRVASPFRLRSEVEAGYSRYFQGKSAEAAATLDSVLAQSTSRRYGSIIARAASTRGIVKYAEGHFSEALVAQRSALDLYERAGEPETAASIHQAIAEPLRAMGELREAWQHVREGLRLVPTIREARRRHSFLASCALGALRQELPEVAVAVLNEDLQLSAASPLPMGTSESLLNRARAWYRMGRLDRSSADLDDASRICQLIPDPLMRRRIEAELTAAQGEILVADRPDLAIERLSESLGRYADVGTRFRQARLLLARGRAELRRQRIDAARHDFLDGVTVLEAQRSSIAQEQLRVSHFDETWDLYGELIRLEAGAGRTDAAFTAAERSRARSLLDASGISAEKTPAEIARALPEGTALLAMSLTDNRLLMWIMTPEGVRFHSSALPAEMLRDDLRAFQSADTASFARAARHMYSVLVSPAEPFLKAATTLVFVPDGPLYRVPFAALMRESDGRYLSESHRIVVAPSATFYGSRPAGLLPQHASTALVVANPSIANRELPPLPAAEREAQAIAALYAHSTVLVRDKATRTRFVDALDSADVLHFAGHAIVSEEFPWLSRLMFASDTDPSRGEGLFVHELDGDRLRRLRLVVLAACSTGAGALVRGEGVLNLARPFLLSGVPSVVVTAWDIDDALAETFFSTFHQVYKATSDPVESLAQTQRRMRESSNPRLRDPRAWSGYTLVSAAGALQNRSSHTHTEER